MHRRDAGPPCCAAGAEGSREQALDVYPYPASSTNISAALMPSWAQEGTRDDMLGRLRDPVTRGRIAREVVRTAARPGRILYGPARTP